MGHLGTSWRVPEAERLKEGEGYEKPKECWKVRAGLAGLAGGFKDVTTAVCIL